MTLKEFLEANPTIFGVCLTTVYGYDNFSGFRYCMTEADFEQDNFQTLNTQGANNLDLLGHLIYLPALQYLEIHPQSGNLLAPMERRIKVLKQLRFLEIRYHDLYGETGKFSLPDLPALERLYIQCYGAVNLKIEKALPALRELHLGNCIITPESVLENLNPQSLEKLTLRGSAKQPKKSDSENLEPIGTFPKLTHLNLSGNGLKALGFSLKALPALEHLDLSNNPQMPLTVEFMYLDKLQKMSLNNTQTLNHKILRTSAEFMQILEDCRAKNVLPAQRENMFNLLLNPAYLFGISRQDWLELYDIITLLPLHQRLLAVLEKQIDIEVGELHRAGELAEICLAGKAQGITAKQLKETFKNHNIKQTNKITDKTELVCIGERAKIDIVRQAFEQNLPVCTPIHLKRFLEELETPYLKEAEVDVHAGLDSLLLSTETENRLLALQLMKTGGIPPHILPFLCLELFNEFALCQPEILALLRRFISQEMYLYLQTAHKKQEDNIKHYTINDLLKSEFFEKEAIAKAIVHFYKPTQKEMHDGYSPKRIFYAKFATRIWKKKELAHIVWNAHFEAETGTLDLIWLHEVLTDLPKNISENAEVKHVLMTGFRIADMPQLVKWKNLEECTVYGTAYALTIVNSAGVRKVLTNSYKFNVVQLTDADIY